jgi:hypothetical protein
VQLAGGEVDVVPTQRHQLTRPQAMAVGDQDGRYVPMAPAIFPGRLDQPLDLALGEALPRTQDSALAAALLRPISRFHSVAFPVEAAVVGAP